MTGVQTCALPISGFISTQLHRAIGDSPTYLNYAVWASNADFRTAFTHPEFRKKISTYPASAVASPHLFQKVSVPGICVAIFLIINGAIGLGLLRWLHL